MARYYSTTRIPPFVRKGDPVRADDANNQVAILRDLIGNGKVHNDSLFGRSAVVGTAQPALFCKAVNVGPQTLSIYSCGVIVGVAIKEAYNSREMTLSIRAYASGDDKERLVITRETIKSNESGYVCIAGMAWVFAQGIGTYGSISSPGDYWLTLGQSGTAQVVAYYPDEFLVLARIGGGGSGGNLALTGGAMWKGVITSQDPVTELYSVDLYAWDEITILTSLTGVAPWPPLGLAFPAGTKVWLVFDSQTQLPAFSV